MTTTTQCPACGTRFRATQAQLQAYHGMVRCGHCHAAFNAIENRISGESTPQLDLPIVATDVSPQTGAAPDTIDLTTAFPEAGAGASAAQKDTGANQEIWRPSPAPRHDRRIWPWAVASALLSVLLLGQAAYLFRVELAARLPGIKPALVAACSKLRCEVSLPRNIDLMAIDSSNLEMDPAQPGIITLSVTLRNMASYVQAYPNLELTLTDYRDAPVGRRLLHPAEYLKNADDEKSGLAAGRENSIRLAIDASGLKAAGYRIFLAY